MVPRLVRTVVPPDFGSIDRKGRKIDFVLSKSVKFYFHPLVRSYHGQNRIKVGICIK
jgi:hypothetical protein